LEVIYMPIVSALSPDAQEEGYKYPQESAYKGQEYLHDASHLPRIISPQV
jgi:hypothetical protein